jgi:predicted Zn-dependent protease
VTGQRELVLISESQEIAMGDQSDPQILAEFGRVPDEALQGYVANVGNKLAAVSHRPELEWHFTVVDSPVVNAFAVPGGYIYFTRGIMAYFNTEAELAGVMGHEIAHVTARHSVRQLSRGQLAQLGLAAGSILSPTFGQFGGAAETALGLLFLRHGRDAERESDRLGVGYAAGAGYDPREVSRFFEVLERLSEAGDRQTLPGWLSTHPDPGERVETTRALSEELISQLSLSPDGMTVNRDAHFRSLDGLVFGDNPREGFMEGGRFYHPDLRFQLSFPSDWPVENTRAAVYALDPEQQAEMQLRLAEVPEGTTARQYVERLAAEGMVPQSGGYRTINGSPAFVGVYALAAQGRTIPVLAAFIEFQGRLYEIIGATSDLGRYGSVMERSIMSFDRLTDSRILNVQPDRLTIYTARQDDTLQALAQRLANPRVDASDLSVLNRLAPDARISAGLLVKLVEPGY